MFEPLDWRGHPNGFLIRRQTLLTSRCTWQATRGGATLGAAAWRPLWAQGQTDVLVPGAGLAGLHAAALLEQAVLRVRVLEAA